MGGLVPTRNRGQRIMRVPGVFAALCGCSTFLLLIGGFAGSTVSVVCGRLRMLYCHPIATRTTARICRGLPESSRVQNAASAWGACTWRALVRLRGRREQLTKCALSVIGKTGENVVGQRSHLGLGVSAMRGKGELGHR